MIEEAELERTEHGVVPVSEGWFIVNAADARWQENPRFGRFCAFEGEPRFDQLGVNIHLLEPGQPACLYHHENQQEAFLVLQGTCLVLIQGEERRLETWDFVHCPPGTNHVFVGAGEGPCAILMMGSRSADKRLTYPVSELAARHGASATKETNSPAEAYAGTPQSKPVGMSWPLG